MFCLWKIISALGIRGKIASVIIRLLVYFYTTRFLSVPVNTLLKLILSPTSVNTKFMFVNNTVRSIARHAIHLQFDISANAFEIRAVQSPECIV
jgi:hypothetical protein